MRLSTLGLISVIASAFAAPAFAGTPASISGSATFSTPAGFTSTVSGESVLPSGFVFSTDAGAFVPAVPDLVTGILPKEVLDNAQVYVVPVYNLQGFSVAVTSLSVGSSAAPSAAPGTSFSATAATILAAAAAAADPNVNGAEFLDPTDPTIRIYNSSNIEFIAAIIKAGAGVNGLD